LPQLRCRWLLLLLCLLRPPPSGLVLSPKLFSLGCLLCRSFLGGKVAGMAPSARSELRWVQMEMLQ
jgi:hypothetical protein